MLCVDLSLAEWIYDPCAGEVCTNSTCEQEDGGDLCGCPELASSPGGELEPSIMFGHLTAGLNQSNQALLMVPGEQGGSSHYSYECVCVCVCEQKMTSSRQR